MADEAALKVLLLQCLAGNDAAHRAFLTEAAAMLRAYFRNRLRGRAEDAGAQAPSTSPKIIDVYPAHPFQRT
ncbi:MAG: hypothetical protein H7124_08195 [Phycisphaerales bacterium]|nr:hypothetical protein [Hyphomonadaceae bacterium]